jgi:hypothetical protein
LNGKVETKPSRAWGNPSNSSPEAISPTVTQRRKTLQTDCLTKYVSSVIGREKDEQECQTLPKVLRFDQTEDMREQRKAQKLANMERKSEFASMTYFSSKTRASN